MFERFTESARRVIYFARYEALQFGAPEIGIEHIVLALFREAPVLMNRLVPEGVTAETVRAAIEARTPPRQQSAHAQKDVPLSLSGKKALAQAARLSDETGTWSIGPGHLLLGLWLEQESFILAVLKIEPEALTQLKTELRPEPVGRSLASAKRRAALRPWLGVARSILILFLCLFVVQVFGKAIEHDIDHNDRVLYPIALLVTGISLCGLTALLRKRFWMTKAGARLVYYGTSLALLLCFAILALHAGSVR